MNRNRNTLRHQRAADASPTLNFGPLTDVWSRRRFLATLALGGFAPAVLRGADNDTTREPGMPYLQSVTSDSIWICWRTDAGTTPVVAYGTHPAALTSTAAGGTVTLGTNYNWHSVKLTGLTPGTFYSYTVSHSVPGSSVPLVSQVYRFRTLPTAGTKDKNILRFLIVGDNQIIDQPRYETILSRAKRTIETRYGAPIEEAVDMLLNVGDQVDGGTLQQYRYVHLNKVAELSRNLAFQTIIGNHETYYDTGMALYKAHFEYDGLGYGGITSPDGDLYYANLVGTVLFLHLNTENTSAAQTNWVSQVLAAANVDPKVEWIVSFAHRPYQAEQYVGDISTWIRNTVAPLLATSPKYVLNVGAHHHLYARGQMRDNPVYHIISGGTAWDQYWGQSTEKDFDDVTKTIANWTWQILEFDLTARTMTVECFSEAHPKLGFVYDSKKVDSFRRRFGIAAPSKPAFTNLPPSAPLTLPMQLGSTAFSGAAGESHYGIQLQVSASSSFTTNAIDTITEAEDYYGDTGAPAYTPVDRSAGINLLAITIPADSLTNGPQYARIRHRDTNATWSAWSDTYAFTVIGSAMNASPSLTLSSRVVAPGANFTATFDSAPGNTRDWIAVFIKGTTPGTGTYKSWKYLNNATSVPTTAVRAGVVTLATTGLTAGTEGYAVMLANDGYTEVSSRVPFYVGATPALTVDNAAIDSGASVTIRYTGAPGGSKDWIGIYKVGQTPGSSTPASVWSYVSGTSGALTLRPPSDGFYYATYLVNDGYYELTDRLAFSCGTDIAKLSLGATNFAYGTQIAVNFTGGAGTPKDYVGVFAKGSVAGVNKLLTYVYVGGATDGSIKITEALPAGDYFLALYINDSYTAISAPVEFSVTGGPKRPEIGGVRRGEPGTLVVSLHPKPGASHRLLHSANMTDWEVVETFGAEGLLMEKVVPWNDADGVGFWKVDTL